MHQKITCIEKTRKGFTSNLVVFLMSRGKVFQKYARKSGMNLRGLNAISRWL